MTAAAILGGAASQACAEDQLGKSFTVYFNSYCDGLAFHRAGGHFVNGVHLNADCGGTNTPVTGTVDKSRYTLFETPQSSFNLAIGLPKPIRDGGSWYIWLSFSGSTWFVGNSGTYHLDSGARAGGSHISTRSRVADLIAARKAAHATTP